MADAKSKAELIEAAILAMREGDEIVPGGDDRMYLQGQALDAEVFVALLCRRNIVRVVGRGHTYRLHVGPQ